jgi:hypothetical protein
MGGVNIYCGSFVGKDKSGTMFQLVLTEMFANNDHENTENTICGIMASIDDASDHILISPEAAADLVLPLTDYLAKLHDSVSADDERMYCLVDLLDACKTAVIEGEPIALVW